jgi:glutamyl-tRNA reductase
VTVARLDPAPDEVADATLPVVAFAVHARDVPADARAAAAGAARAWLSACSGLLLETCHRVDLYVPRALADEAQQVVTAALGGEPGGARELRGVDAVRHLLATAVGLDSAVLGEDQVLHQLRRAVAEGRSRGTLPSGLGRIADRALREGRRARTWRSAPPRSLAALALDRLEAGIGPSAGRPVLVAGAGAMGALVVAALARRRASPLVASRDPARAARLAAAHGAVAVPLDPGDETLGRVAGVVVALAGPWHLSAASVAAMARADAPVVDLSQPPALPPALLHLGARRITTVDDLAAEREPTAREHALRARLWQLVDAALADLHAEASRRDAADVVRALADHADAERRAELEHLFRTMPGLSADERAAIERMTAHLARRLLREPFQRLAGPTDERHAAALREVFGL